MMKQRSDLLDRAKMTVERTALVLRDLRDELDAAAGLDSRDQHAMWDAITDLEWRHSLLADFYLDMLLSPPTELGERWERFTICHEDFREAMREVRSGLTHAYRGRPGAAPASAAARPQPQPPPAER